MPAASVRTTQYPIARRWGTALIWLACSACCAVDGPLVDAEIAPVSGLVRGWPGSVLQRALDGPASAPLRDMLDRMLSEERTRLRDAKGLLLAARSLRIRCDGEDDAGQPVWAVQADLGTRAPQAVRSLVAGARFPWVRTVAAADEAWQIDGIAIARFGGVVACGRPVGLLPLPPLSGRGDIRVRSDLRACAAAVRRSVGEDRPVLAAVVEALASGWGRIEAQVAQTSAGSTWSGRLDGDVGGLRPLDRVVLAELPVEAIGVVLAGVDGRRWWTGHGAALAAAITASASADIAAALADPAVRGGLQGLVSSCEGTIAVVATPGVPVPGFSVLLPRGPGLDAFLEAWCRRRGAVFPDEGAHVLLPVPELPVPVLLARARGRWLLSSDAGFAASWGGSGRRTASGTLVKALADRAPADACVMAAWDGGALLRSAAGLFADAVAGLRGMDGDDRQSLLAASTRLSTLLEPARQWAVARDGALDIAGEGGDLLWPSAVMAAALSVPGWIEGSIPPAEAAAVATLRSALFQAQLRFQADARVDQDGDGIGEYGFLGELAGRRPLAIRKDAALRQLPAEFATGDVSGGYRFAVWLPDGHGGAMGEPAQEGARPSIVGPGGAADADEQESGYVIYAWPATEGSGRRIFAIDQRGQVYEALWDGQEPRWNSLYDGGGWLDEPAWPALKRGARRR